MKHLFILAFAALLFALPCFADGLGDNNPAKVRQVPPPGIQLPEGTRKRLRQELEKIEAQIEKVRTLNAGSIPDVEIFTRGVRTVFENDEFFTHKDVEAAFELLKEAELRIGMIQRSDLTHLAARTGLVVRGYRSKIDHTVQPYGLVIPENYSGNSRLDIWFHGRGERTSEVGFIHQRMNKVGQYAPPNTIVLHPYGRYSNAFKFAGEVDVLEALADVQKKYSIDPDRISVRGFSMGGAGCWQFSVLYSDRWFASNPGAGFSETPEFLKFFQKETLNPTWYQKKLWQWYDCNGYAMNLVHCPTVAYSGELDIQKQAADIMDAALKKEDIDLVHIIGPQTKHSIHPDSKIEIERRMSELARAGRDRSPDTINFRTYSLKYNRRHWVTVDGLTEHWTPATVKAKRASEHSVVVSTENATGLTLDFPAGTFRDIRTPVSIKIDGTKIAPQRPASDRSLRISFVKADENWKSEALPNTLRKRHNLQGPIDDAFMDSFIFVQPTADGGHEAVDNWATTELEHAIKHWRQQFRGDARLKDDSEITDQDIASANLVLFGTPKSNQLLAKVVEDLPLQYADSKVQIGEKTYDADHHAPILIYPNPLNPSRYVVLNSGFTYREYAYLNNARQVPMLPDWAIVDVRTPPTSQFPGKVVAADFFDEQWKVKANQPASSK